MHTSLPTMPELMATRRAGLLDLINNSKAKLSAEEADEMIKSFYASWDNIELLQQVEKKLSAMVGDNPD